MSAAAEILSGPPISGTIDEEHYGEPGGQRVWICFTPPEAARWAGDFRAGGVNLHVGACPFADDSAALVIACGRGYLVDLSTKALLQTARDDLVAAIAIPRRGLVVAHSHTRLFAYDRSGEVWQSEDIADDGISLRVATDEALVGAVGTLDRPTYEHRWLPFTLRFDGWMFERSRSRE